MNQAVLLSLNKVADVIHGFISRIWSICYTIFYWFWYVTKYQVLCDMPLESITLSSHILVRSYRSISYRSVLFICSICIHSISPSYSPCIFIPSLGFNRSKMQFLKLYTRCFVRRSQWWIKLYEGWNEFPINLFIEVF